MSVEHWMTFGTFAQQDYFEYPKVGTYSGVVINANMAAAYPAGLAAFLLEKTRGMKYLIDPLTHAFQHSPEVLTDSDGEPKKAMRVLADAYGEPVSTSIGEDALLPDAFRTEKVLEPFVRRCVDFQLQWLPKFMLQADAAKYLDDDEKSQPPYAVVAPYFFLTETTLDDWLPVVVRAAKIASKFGAAEGFSVFAGVVVGQGIILDASASRKIADALAEVPLAGYMLWIDDLDEEVANEAELAGFLRLSRLLRGTGKEKREVLNLHGGYFSVLAGGNGGSGSLSGVAHGPEFGEHRGVVPVGGGIPIARYYLPALHVRSRFRDAVRILRRKGWLASAAAFHENVCACTACKEVLEGDADHFQRFGESTVKSVRRKHGIVRIDFPTTEAKKRCLLHYLQRKNKEFVAANDAPKKVLLDALEHEAAEYSPVVGLEGVAHLRRWKKVLA